MYYESDLLRFCYIRSIKEDHIKLIPFRVYSFALLIMHESDYSLENTITVR